VPLPGLAAGADERVEVSRTTLNIFAPVGNLPVPELYDNATMIGFRSARFAKRELDAAHLQCSVEPEVFDSKKGTGSKRAKIGSELIMPGIELNIGWLHVFGIFGEARQRILGLLCGPCSGQSLKENPKTLRIMSFGHRPFPAH